MIKKNNMAVHFCSDSPEWSTPQDLYDGLDAEFGFTLDPACTHENAKCERHFTAADDGLSFSWAGEIVFLNPPYGRVIARWVQKAWEESQDGATVVCLVPARTDTGWWHGYCMKGEIRFLKGRLYFSRADGSSGRAPFPSAIVIFRPEASDD